MGIGYTRRDLENVKTTGDPPVNTDRPRTSKRQQLVDQLWQAFIDAQTWRQAQAGGTRYGSPTGGKYAGFGTQSELTDYVRGRGLALDDEAAAWYDRINELTGQQTLDTGYTYQAGLEKARTQRDAAMPKYGDYDSTTLALQQQRFGGSADAAERIYLERLAEPVDVWATVTGPGQRGAPPVNRHADPLTNYDVMGGGAGAGATSGRWMPPSPWQSIGEQVPQVTIPIGEQLYKQHVVDTGADARYREREAQLAGVRDDRLDTLGANLDYASLLNDLDIHDWAQMAATNELGIDPSFAAGAWGPEMSLAYHRTENDLAGLPVDQFETDRDLWALETFGMPYDDYVAAEKERAAAERQQQTDLTAQEQAAADAADKEARLVFAETPGVNGIALSVDPYDLADATDIPVEMLGEIVQSPEFSQAIDTLTSLYTEGTDADPVEYANSLAATDPVLYRMLREIYPDLFPRADIDG